MTRHQRPWNPDRDLPDPGIEPPPMYCASCGDLLNPDTEREDVVGMGRRARLVPVCPECYAEANPVETEES